MLNIPEGATIIVTNESSRSFICGGNMILPHVPTEVDKHLAFAIDGSPYGMYFKFEFESSSPAEKKSEDTA